jgi:hypothetical protein
MVDTFTQFEKNGLTVEVNWNDEVKPCKFIKFKIGEHEAIIPNGDFYGMMMIFGTPEQQEALIPVKESKIRMVTSLLKIRAKKDLKRGEIIVVPHTYPVSAATYERIKFEGGSGNQKLDRDILKTGAQKKPKDSYRDIVTP